MKKKIETKNAQKFKNGTLSIPKNIEKRDLEWTKTKKGEPKSVVAG